MTKRIPVWRVWIQKRKERRPDTILYNGVRIINHIFAEWQDIGTVRAPTQLAAFKEATRLPHWRKGDNLLVEPEENQKMEVRTHLLPRPNRARKRR